MNLTNEMSSGKMMNMEEIETTNGSAFSAFDFTAEDVDAALKLKEEAAKRGKPICSCGHPEGRHDFSENTGSDYCTANKQNCKCKKKVFVLEAEDARVFLRKTTGPGPLHALAQGIREAEANGQVLKWIVPIECSRCKKVGPVSPAPVNERGTVMDADTGFNVLLCSECRYV